MVTINPLRFHHFEEKADTPALRFWEELTAALRAFTKLQKAIINFVMSLCCLSVRMEQLKSQGKDFHDIWFLSIFRKICRENSRWNSLTRIPDTLHIDISAFTTVSLRFLETINVADKRYRGNQNINFMFSNFSRKSCLFWDNMQKYGTARQATDDNIIRRTRFAFWVTNVTDTYSEHVILFAFPEHQRSR